MAVFRLGLNVFANLTSIIWLGSIAVAQVAGRQSGSSAVRSRRFRGRLPDDHTACRQCILYDAFGCHQRRSQADDEIRAAAPGFGRNSTVAHLRVYEAIRSRDEELAGAQVEKLILSALTIRVARYGSARMLTLHPTLPPRHAHPMGSHRNSGETRD